MELVKEVLKVGERGTKENSIWRDGRAKRILLLPSLSSSEQIKGETLRIKRERVDKVTGSGGHQTLNSQKMNNIRRLMTTITIVLLLRPSFDSWRPLIKWLSLTLSISKFWSHFHSLFCFYSLCSACSASDAIFCTFTSGRRKIMTKTVPFILSLSFRVCVLH